MSRPLLTLALVTTFLFAGGLAPMGTQSMPTATATATAVTPANVTIIEKNQIWPMKLQGCQRLRCVAA
jgi:hypothetical protein